MCEEYRVELLPHYEVKDGALLFLGRQKLTIQREYVDILRQIAKGPLRYESVDSDAQAVCEQLRKRSIVAIYRQDHPSRSSRKCLVLSPHMDDAAFSIGGILAKLRSAFAVNVVNIFTDDHFTIQKWMRTDREFRNRIRYSEEALVSRMLGWRMVNIGLQDIGERKGASVNLAELRRIVLDIWKKTQPDLLFAPSGIGSNTDHVIIHNVISDLASRLWLTPILLYEDMPYGVHCHPKRENADIVVDVTQYIGCKRELMEIYQTQITKGGIQSVCRHMNALAFGKGYKEQLWLLQHNGDEGIPPWLCDLI